MAAVTQATTQAAYDDLDNLAHYGAMESDLGFTIPESNAEAAAPPSPRRPKPIDLGLDEEVKQHARKPNPKLDEDRYFNRLFTPA